MDSKFIINEDLSFIYKTSNSLDLKKIRNNKRYKPSFYTDNSSTSITCKLIYI